MHYEKVKSVDGGLLDYNLTLIIKFSFTHVGAMTYMEFAGSAVFAEGDCIHFIVGPSLGTALLGVAAFGIWHNVWF